MTETLLIIGIIIACYVAYNIGGATTGPAFGPAVGAQVISKPVAGALMSVFFFIGAWTIGRRVVQTLGEDIVHDPGIFTLSASIVVLFFIGSALLLGNLTGAPASTSMTAVGAIAGLAYARGVLDFAVVGEILAWWLLSPLIGFWVAVMIGRYWYDLIDRYVAIERSKGPLLQLAEEGSIPRLQLGPNTSRRELFGTIVVVGIGCLMAISSGASNIANAIAPLVGAGDLRMNVGIVIGSIATAVGALTIARRTMETLGNDITDLPLTAAIVVAVLSSVIVLLLSAIGIPASFVIIATVCIIGLGWGRASRQIPITDAITGTTGQSISVGALGADREAPTIGDPTPAEDLLAEPPADRMPAASELFDPGTSVRVILTQNLVPVLATVASYATFISVGTL